MGNRKTIEATKLNDIINFFTKTAVSAARSLLLSETKGVVKNFINAKRAKTPLDIEAEMKQRIGYATAHYTINKNQDITFKSSPLFVKEWLTNTPKLVGKIIKDEETGAIYHDNELIAPGVKLALMDEFIRQTSVKTAALTGHFDNAFKLFPVSNINGGKFREQFKGWDTNNASSEASPCYADSIIDGFLNGCFGIDDPLSKKLWRKWIVGTARRITHPGSSLDGCLLIKSKPGTGKTSFFRQLLPEPFARSTEIYCNIKNAQKFIENITGYSIVNFDELSPLELPKTAEIFKQLMTSQRITVRLPWRRDPQEFGLRAGFCATTNKEQFITDPTLSRRLWVLELPAELQRLNFDYLHANRTALWQEALWAADNKEVVYLTPTEQTEVEAFNQKFLC